MCHVLDVNYLISNPYNRSNVIYICTRDNDLYGLQVAVCDYSSPETLLRRLVGRGRPAGGGGI